MYLYLRLALTIRGIRGATDFRFTFRHFYLEKHAGNFPHLLLE